MPPLPWRYVSSWLCSCCGICCKEFEVVLRFDEWLNLVRTYGVGVTKAGLNKFYIRKKQDSTCIFLYQSHGRWLCGLQNMKPVACKLWPFKILGKPKYGRAREALFNYNGGKFFVYVDPLCPGIRWGKPVLDMVYKVIPEFVEIALGIRKNQVYSTSMIPSRIFPQKKRNYIVRL